MTLEMLSVEPEGVLFLVDSKGTAHPDSLAPFTRERVGRHWLFRDGLRRKSVLAGETFQWDGMTFVVLEASDQPRRLQGGGGSDQNAKFNIAVSALPTLVRSLSRVPAVRAAARVGALTLVCAFCIAGGRFLTPDGVAFAPAFEQTTSSLEAHGLFHRLSLLRVAMPAPAPGTPPNEFAPPATPSAASGTRRIARSSPERATERERDARGHVRRGEDVPSRFFLTPGD